MTRELEVAASRPGRRRAFGNRLRQVRASVHISQSHLAKALGGYRTDTISRIERGDSTGIPLDLLVNLAAWMIHQGISLRWLFADAGEMRAGRAAAQAVGANAPQQVHGSLGPGLSLTWGGVTVRITEGGLELRHRGGACLRITCPAGPVKFAVDPAGQIYPDIAVRGLQSRGIAIGASAGGPTGRDGSRPASPAPDISDAEPRPVVRLGPGGDYIHDITEADLLGERHAARADQPVA